MVIVFIEDLFWSQIEQNSFSFIPHPVAVINRNMNKIWFSQNCVILSLILMTTLFYEHSHWYYKEKFHADQSQFSGLKMYWMLISAI